MTGASADDSKAVFPALWEAMIAALSAWHVYKKKTIAVAGLARLVLQ